MNVKYLIYKRMKSKKFNLGAIFLVAIAAMLYSCGGKSDAKNSEIKNQTEGQIKNVKVLKLTKEEIGREIDYPANILPNDEVYLAPSTPGRIMKIHVDVGDRVSAGQLLVEMDPTQLNNAILQLNSLEKDKARFDTLILYEGISKQQYDQFQTQLEVTRANVELLKINTNLSAPFSGVVTARYFEEGELYTGAPNNQAGKPAILVIQQINPVKAVISVSEKYFPDVKIGTPVKLKTDIYPDKVFNGVIKLVYPTINAQTKTFNVEIEVPNNEQLLRPGMYARVNFEFAKENALVVPASAVLQQMGTNIRYVFVNDNGVAKRINVQIGKRFDDKIEIISEQISENTELIVTGQAGLNDGAKINVVE